MPLTTATMVVSASMPQCNTLPHTVTHCNICPNDGCFGSMSMYTTLQYTTMHHNASCFTLQRTATWCNALQQMPLPTATTADITLADATFNSGYGATGYEMRKHTHKPHAHWHIFPPPPFPSYYPTDATFDSGYGAAGYETRNPNTDFTGWLQHMNESIITWGCVTQGILSQRMCTLAGESWNEQP